MSLSPTTAQAFLLASDFPIDKVVYKKQTTQTVTTDASSFGDYKTYTFAHGLSFTPLCIGSYSDDGFSTSYEYGGGPRMWNVTYMQFTYRIVAAVASDATNVYIYVSNFDTARSIAFRIVGLPPTALPSTTFAVGTNDADVFMLSTGFNYLKIHSQGTITHNDSGAGGYDTLIFTHSLGYVPTALVFSEVAGKVRLCGSELVVGPYDGLDCWSTLTNSSLSVVEDYPVAATLKFHYKVYLDA